jgi:hypothetical protein
MIAAGTETSTALKLLALCSQYSYAPDAPVLVSQDSVMAPSISSRVRDRSDSPPLSVQSANLS